MNGHGVKISPKKSLLERIRDGAVIGDGGLITEMEQRGYARTGIWTPEVCVQHPAVVKGLHRELAHAGADVLQALNFYANDEKLKEMGILHSVEEINRAAVKLVHEVAAEGDQLVTASLTSSPLFRNGGTKQEVIDSLHEQLKPIMERSLDFIMCEWVFDIREMEYVIEAAKETGLTIVACMSMGTKGDQNGVSPGECAVRMARAGADVVGTNCIVGPRNALQTIRQMKTALQQAGLQRPLILQPAGLKTPDDGTSLMNCCTWPMACEPVYLTRFEARQYAREAYEEGVRYIGGCCYFRAYHIRAMAEELIKERGGILPAASHKLGWGSDLVMHPNPNVRQRYSKDYWMNLKLPAPEIPDLTKSAREYFADWQRS